MATEKKPVVYLSLTEVAEALGLSVNTVKFYASEKSGNLLPPPDALVGRNRGWLRQTIKNWNYNRPNPSRVAPDPSMLKNSRDRRVRR